jgi:type I restriction-modification system DNA methylase subunit
LFTHTLANKLAALFLFLAPIIYFITNNSLITNIYFVFLIIWVFLATIKEACINLLLKKPNANVLGFWKIKQENSNEAALRRYANQCRQDIKDMFPKGIDGTTIFNGTIFVNEKGNPNLSQANLFGKVLESFQKYDEKNGSFKYVTKEFKTRLYETFLRQSAGVKNLGQYFTPRNVIQAMVKMSNANMLNEGARFCDPFCGVGGSVLETIAMTPTIYKMYETKNGKINPKITILGFDKGTDEKEDERTIILAKANMLIYFSDLLARYHSKIHLKSFSDNAFNNVFHLLRTNLGTFGKIDEHPFDLILTNPPYVTSGSSSIKEALNTDESLKRYAENNENEQYYSANGRGTQALAIEWIINNLKQGGYALVIVPDNLLLQINMLEYIKKTCNITGIVSLPARTFYATAQKTYILVMEKKSSNSIQEGDIFTYLVSEIGETRDSKRFVYEQNDLIEAATLFNLFKTGNPIPISKRCKILHPDDFFRLDNWLVDRLWTEEEKQGLGIEDEKETISDDEFWHLVSDIKNYLVDILGDNIR